MSKRCPARLAAVALLAVACGGDGSGSFVADSGDTGEAPDSGVPPDAQVVADAGFGPCDPLTGSGCPGADVCVWVPTADVVQCRSLRSPALALDATCDPLRSSCEAGATCVLVQGVSDAHCRQTCRPSEGNADCADLLGDHVCVELSPSSGEYGICKPLHRLRPR